MRQHDWWRHAVTYQIYPRSFQDSNGDGIGDLEGIRRRLGYVSALGADAIWICPFVQSPMRDFGYDVSDYLRIDPMFGTLDDFDALINDAHALGLRVLMDQVWNHTSDQHPWFSESRSSRSHPKADWYVWADPAGDGGPPNNWRSAFGGSAWSFDEQRQQYYLHNFLPQQPDINWYCPEARRAVLDSGRFWLQRGVDGFRLDVVNFFAHDRSLSDDPRRPQEQPRPAGAGAGDTYFDFIHQGTVCRPETLQLLAEVRGLMNEYPGTVALGEISSAEDTLVAAADYVAGDRRLHLAYNASLISDRPFRAQALRDMLRHTLRLFPDARLCWTFGTHDFPRLKGRWFAQGRHTRAIEDRLDRMLAALLVILPGSCCIYQGDELGLTQAQIPFEHMRDPYGIANYPHVLGRDGCRTPMPWSADAVYAGFTEAASPWLPVAPEHLPLAVDRQDRDERSLLNAYRRLLRWRRHEPALQGTGLRVPAPPDSSDVLLLERFSDGGRLLCAFNFAVDPQTIQVPARSTPALEGWPQGNATETGTLRLPGYGCALIRLRPDTLV